MSRRRKRSDMRIYLQGECPKIGDGWRGVQLLKIGRRWVRFCETATGVAARLPIEAWREKAKSAREVRI